MKAYKIEANQFRGFYDTQIHKIEIDNVTYFPLTDEEYRALLQGQSQGLRIVYEDGKMQCTDKPMELPPKMAKSQEKVQLVGWFNGEYRKNTEKYTRLAALGRVCDDLTDPAQCLSALYVEAEQKRSRI